MPLANHSYAIISLLKGIVYSSNNKAWNNLLQYENDVKDYFKKAGLEVFIDIPEGYAYLKQIEWEEEVDLPILAERRQLNFNTSLLLLQLRKHLLEQDRDSGNTRSIVTRTEIKAMMWPFMRTTNNEAKLEDEIKATINKMVNEYGFLRRLTTDEEKFEINRVIKGFVGANEVEAALQRLREAVKETDDTAE